MTPAAVLMLLVAVLIIWGGLVASVVFLIRFPLSAEPHPHDDHDFDRYPPEYQV
ncbi:MAG: methionine/alanine import family NSS transporter small subunit [Propioniciclava sp.]